MTFIMQINMPEICYLLPMQVKPMKQQHWLKAAAEGDYSSHVLEAFKHDWQSKQSARTFLRYAVMLRNLGHSLNKSEAHLLYKLQKQAYVKLLLKGLSRHQIRQLNNLADELQNNTHSAQGVPAHSRRFALSLRAQQTPWRDTLESELNQAKSVVVVGNSPNLLGTDQGEFIDAHDLVIRFNQFSPTDGSDISKSIGKKLDIWVMSPGFRGTIPEHARFILITGPNMVWWQQNWQHLIHTNVPIIGIPLASWQLSVEKLAAPASAGFACLDWLMNYQRIANIRPSAMGFGYNPAQQSRYHIQNKTHQATSRHNWRAEQEVIKTWKDELKLNLL
ncbi:hypothetical protein CWE25_07530 [Idiomarina fontislapidosi]|uniref:Uncharacterized protein n=2 Tax=Idiomarina fontislapidosi TaxID=263723 RepID=A0A432XYS2_9GAMM|nr:hypothetical protein CWE25_07530 [Idiomarina fontislapidosi]